MNLRIFMTDMYFDENDEMHERLCDIFYGAVHYKELK